MMSTATEIDERNHLWVILLHHAVQLVQEMRDHAEHGRIEDIIALEEAFVGLTAELEHMDEDEIIVHHDLLQHLHHEVMMMRDVMVAQRDAIITQLGGMGSATGAVKAYIKSSLVLPEEHE
ncbi:MAG: hypothetical protein EAY65_00400 [Alphaproteobacteria bacterium]|nr:MAG: hypothetical protein EAY65_00400 [Alphaproteobacteria bacterium]